MAGGEVSSGRVRHLRRSRYCRCARALVEQGFDTGCRARGRDANRLQWRRSRARAAPEAEVAGKEHPPLPCAYAWRARSSPSNSTRGIMPRATRANSAARAEGARCANIARAVARRSGRSGLEARARLASATCGACDPAGRHQAEQRRARDETRGAAVEGPRARFTRTVLERCLTGRFLEVESGRTRQRSRTSSRHEARGGLEIAASVSRIELNRQRHRDQQRASAARVSRTASFSVVTTVQRQP